MRAIALAMVLVLASGCLDFLGRGLAQHDVARTPLDEDGWNTGGVFSVIVREAVPVDVVITGTATDGRVIRASGASNATLPPVELLVPDGTWRIAYTLDGDRWESFDGVRFDSTPPTLTALQTLGDAVAGSYTIGTGAVVEAGASVRVVAQASDATIATSLPVTLSNLPDGIHAYDVIVTDEAGNQLAEQVQVRAGSATALPAGQNTLGLVARYTINAYAWDITDLDAWGSPAAARAATDGQWLGSGRAIAPDDAAVQSVVDATVTPTMSTGRAAFALFRFMADELEYDRARLEANTLLTPRQTLLDTEDARDDTASGTGDGNGLARDGSGNGVKGGVCRDLAALYVSLLRGAGIPARLVTGYLGGEVNGFHAWVEFYGGDGHGPSPWVPVDVSAINGPYEAEVALQAFGLRHTDMLPLRVVSATQEQGPWSAAVAVSTRYPADGAEPDIDLEKRLTRQFEVEGVLCVDLGRLARTVISGTSVNDCPDGYSSGIPRFVRSASHVLDYGAEIASAGPGTTVTLTLSFPDADAVAPGTVEQARYGDVEFRRDDARGAYVGTWTS